MRRTIVLYNWFFGFLWWKQCTRFLSFRYGTYTGSYPWWNHVTLGTLRSLWKTLSFFVYWFQSLWIDQMIQSRRVGCIWSLLFASVFLFWLFAFRLSFLCFWAFFLSPRWPWWLCWGWRCRRSFSLDLFCRSCFRSHSHYPLQGQNLSSSKSQDLVLGVKYL